MSEGGLERLAQRIGLDCLAEEHTAPDGRKKKTIIIAGTAIQLDIVLDNNIVESITLAFPESAPSVTKHVDAANRILLQDLQLRPDQSPLTKTLDKFAVNLQRLAALDKLSIIPGLDCHEALAGIYDSLERLHQWDISRLRDEPGMGGKSDKALSVIAACTRHGYPVMHSRDRVGLALQYWRDFRNIPPSNPKLESVTEETEKIWSLLIGCAATGDMGHLPVRVSENWISKEIIKPEVQLDPKKPILDWQEPANVVLPPSEENKDGAMELLQPDLSTTRVPQVMFTVTFDPPVILPQTDWFRLHAYANIPTPQISAYGPTFDSLFFPIPSGSPQDPSGFRAITRRRDVRVFDKESNASTKTHRNTLLIYKQIYSQMVTEMPFSHPRELIDMLPLLRQYAFISQLLENSFGSDTQEAQSTTPAKNAPTSGSKTTTTARDELGDFVGAPPTVEEEISTPKDYTNLDVTLWVHPTPHLQVVFPFHDSTANVALNVLEDGVVEITDENVIPQEGDGQGRKLKGREVTRADLGKVLEHMEDLCKWTEWIRTRLS